MSHGQNGWRPPKSDHHNNSNYSDVKDFDGSSYVRRYTYLKNGFDCHSWWVHTEVVAKPITFVSQYPWCIEIIEVVSYWMIGNINYESISMINWGHISIRYVYIYNYIYIYITYVTLDLHVATPSPAMNHPSTQSFGGHFTSSRIGIYPITKTKGG